MSGYFVKWEQLIVIIVVITSLLCPSVRAKACVMKTQCICEFDDASGTVDITSIGRQDGVPLIQDVVAVDNYAYSFNPCFPFTEGTCTNAAACQSSLTGEPLLYYNIGDSAKVDFSFDGANVVGTYLADDDARTSIVTYVCDPNVDPPTWTVNGETSGTAQYTFTITSKAACPNAGPTQVPPTVDVSVDISVGSILTIIFFVALVLYVVAGVSYNRFRRERTGRELMPNIGFWAAIPALIKEGLTFTFSLCGRRHRGYEQK